MSLPVQRADWFKEDFDRQFRWYLKKAGESVAEGYFTAVERTIEMLGQHPGAGTLRHFRHPKLNGLRSFRVERPYTKHLIFYRSDETTLCVERIMHGARNLPRRLLNRPAHE